MIIKRFHQSCFSIRFQNTLIYLDPYKIPEISDKADVVLFTHGHRDHYDIKAIENIQKEDTVFISPSSCKKILNSWNAKGVTPGDILLQNSLEINTVPMYNTKFIPKMMFHPKRKKLTGYIISDGTIKIYHAGDTNLIPEMNDLGQIDFAFLPIGGFFTMNIHEALEATARIHPKFVIPMHELKQDLEQFRKLIQDKHPDIKPIILTENDIFET